MFTFPLLVISYSNPWYIPYQASSLTWSEELCFLLYVAWSLASNNNMRACIYIYVGIYLCVCLFVLLWLIERTEEWDRFALNAAPLSHFHCSWIVSVERCCHSETRWEGLLPMQWLFPEYMTSENGKKNKWEGPDLTVKSSIYLFFNYLSFSFWIWKFLLKSLSENNCQV